LFVSGAGRAGLLRGAHFMKEARTIHAERGFRARTTDGARNTRRPLRSPARPSAAPALSPRPLVTVCCLPVAVCAGRGARGLALGRALSQSAGTIHAERGFRAENDL